MTKTTTPARGSSTANAWFKTYPANELETLDMATARQIALYARLRNRYWLTECAPLSRAAIDRVVKKMALIDPRDKMEETEVQELLAPDFGFVATESGWTVPDLDAARAEALGSIDAIRQRMSALGRASAAKRGTADADPKAVPLRPAPAGPLAAADDDDF
jgi:hypothetical protein